MESAHSTTPGFASTPDRLRTSAGGLLDQFGRRVDNLRISVTDRCNFRCVYCMPEEGLQWMPRSDLLSFEEIARVVRIFSALGVRKLRLTGGEPLLRRDLPVLVASLAAIDGIEDISLTTNGFSLARHAAPLASAGLNRVNVSLDSLVRDVFARVVRRDALDEVLEGLDAAARHFPGPVKINTVLVRGVNDSEVVRFAELARRPNFEVRFIEFMPLDADGGWSRERTVSGAEVRAKIAARYPLVRDPLLSPSAPAATWVFADGQGGKIGFIDSVSEPFCDQCNRVRLTADGKLRTCLFSVEETDLRELLRQRQAPDEAVDARIAERIRAAVWRKEAGHRIGQADFVPASRSMSQIGG